MEAGQSHELQPSSDDSARIDYANFLMETGLDEQSVRSQSENLSDQIPFPSGEYKIAVAESSIEGSGLIATDDIYPGETIAPARLSGMRTAAGRYANHSGTPNAAMKLSDDGDFYLVAKARIRCGEEVTVDYANCIAEQRRHDQPCVFKELGISIHSNKATMEEIERFEQYLLANGATKDLPLRHFFFGGVYARELTIPKGVVLTGRLHLLHNLNILSKGEVSVLTENGIERVKAPFSVLSPPGTKRVIYAHEESVWTTILPTNLTDPDEAEQSVTCGSYAEYVALQHQLENKEG